MNQKNIQAVAEALVASRRAATRDSSTELRDSLADAAAAYGVQDAVARTLNWFGDEFPACWKSGGGSRTATLTHAPLPPAGVRQSPATFADLTLHAPGLEAEIALRIGSEVSPTQAANLTAETARLLIDAMAVSVEIVDSRWGDAAAASALLKLADMQSHGALALGDWIPFVALDWSTQVCEVRIGGRELVSRAGTHPLGDPAWLLPTWLKHATRGGQHVPAGTVVTTGSWVGILPLRKGDTATVAFPGLGTVWVGI